MMGNGGVIAPQGPLQTHQELGYDVSLEPSLKRTDGVNEGQWKVSV